MKEKILMIRVPRETAYKLKENAAKLKIDRMTYLTKIAHDNPKLKGAGDGK